MIEFAYPWALFALLGVIFLYYFERHWRRRPSIVVSSARPFAALRRHRNRLGIVEYLMLAGAVVLVSYPRIEGATGLPARVWAITP